MAIEVITAQFKGFEKIPTPLDERGLVDIRQLAIDLGEYYQTFGSRPVVSSEPRNIHHLYYNEADYLRHDEEFGNNLATRFRERQINKIRLPLPIHQDIHRLFIKSPIPEPEIMKHVISSEFSLRVLYSSYRQAVRWERDLQFLLGNRNCLRRPKYPLKQLQSKIKGALSTAEEHCALYGQVPREARVDPSLNPELPLVTISRKIGEFLQLRSTSWTLALQISE